MVGATSANQAAQVAQTNAQNLSAIFPVASGGAGGLGAALTSFFAAMNAISQDPTSLPDRQTFLSDAQSLAANFNSVGGQLASNLTALNGQIDQRGRADQHADPADRQAQPADRWRNRRRAAAGRQTR